MPADPDRRVGLLHREGFAADIGVLVEAAIEARGRLGPELLEYGNPLIGHRAARIEGWAVQRLEFLLQPSGRRCPRGAGRRTGHPARPPPSRSAPEFGRAAPA